MSVERRGRVYRRCSCRDKAGKQLGRFCPRLATDGKHGTWYFAVDLPATTEKRRTMRRGGFSTKSAASRALADVTNRAASGVRIDDRETVADFLARWLQVKVGEAKPTTLRSYRAHVENVIVPAIGHMPLERLRAEHVEQLLTDAMHGRGPVTVRRIHATLRSALSYGVKTRRLPFNVASNVTPPNGARPEVHPWSAAELAVFLRHVETDRLGPLFEVIAACGLRRGEALGLRWADLDLANRTARIRQTVVDVGGRLEFSTPKTRSSEATVPLTERAVQALLQWRLGQDIDRQAWGDAYEDHDLVFARENGAPLRPEYVTRRFVALSRAAGLRPVRLHDLRHGAASLMLAAGVPMAIVSKMLRHSSIGITVDTYGHLSEDTARTASDAMAAALEQAFETTAAAAGDHTATTAGAESTSQAGRSPKSTGQGGGPRGDRTHNPRIKSPLLCQLS
ncbi:Site-specific recombinase XerD [Geodermatophilus africanus]|uniref:Site-specific recombinase XerD n=1 Tax=Geodermatophilus africanus TaxID=1137993 RepID=A0A1H3KCC0_9ACTN|nr:Site-specific recombinase XerD [Geodermatophilus africanus]